MRFGRLNLSANSKMSNRPPTEDEMLLVAFLCLIAAGGLAALLFLD